MIEQPALQLGLWQVLDIVAGRVPLLIEIKDQDVKAAMQITQRAMEEALQEPKQFQR